jgi:hypothetical protein
MNCRISKNDLALLDTPEGNKIKNQTTIQPVMSVPMPIMDGKWNSDQPT